MKVHLIKKQSIEDYVVQNAQSRLAFNNWLSLILHANWDGPFDILKTFQKADVIGDGSSRVVFNIGGNKYRMICKYFFGKNRVHLFIKWIGTHAEYTKICKDGKQYSINNY